MAFPWERRNRVGTPTPAYKADPTFESASPSPPQGADSASIRHRFPDLMSNRCWIDAKLTPEEGRARRIRGWGQGGLCLINPSQYKAKLWINIWLETLDFPCFFSNFGNPEDPYLPNSGGGDSPPKIGVGESQKITCFTVLFGVHSRNSGGEIFTPRIWGLWIFSKYEWGDFCPDVGLVCGGLGFLAYFWRKTAQGRVHQFFCNLQLPNPLRLVLRDWSWSGEFCYVHNLDCISSQSLQRFSWKCKSCFSNRALVKTICKAPKYF